MKSSKSSTKLRVATLNLLDDPWRQAERLALALAELKRLKPDVLFLQEVSPGLDKQLAKELPGYYLSSSLPLLTLSRQKPLSHSLLGLSQGRAAQKISLQVGSRAVNFINVHLYFSVARDKPRWLQTKQIAAFANPPAVIGGDFNATLKSRSLTEFNHRFKDAYEAVHRAPAPWTSPTPLWRGRGLQNSLRRSGFKAATTLLRGPLGNMHGAIDHILVDKDFVVSGCSLVFNSPSPQDSRLYASDHYGLIADVKFR